MASSDDHRHQSSQAEICERLAEGAALLRRPGTFNLSDASLPTETTHRCKSWRCLPMTRIGLVLSGEHELAYVRHSKTAESRLFSGDMWCYPSGTHDDEMFLHPCRYISAVFFEDYTRFVIVTSSGPSETYPPPTWFHWHGERTREIKATLVALHQSLECRGAELIVAHLCRALWLQLLAWLPTVEGGQTPFQGKARATWGAVHRILEENYHRPMNRQTVADSLQIHPNRVSELCREFGGDTFQHLLERRRIRQAKQFLESSSTKIEAIAVMCGFSGATYFNRAFRRAAEMAPGEWRRRHGR